jgi:hypothetical protein
LKPTEVTTPASAAARAISDDSAADLPIGFSIQNGLPAAAAASATSWCRKFGAQIDTTSTSGSAITSR